MSLDEFVFIWLPEGESAAKMRGALASLVATVERKTLERAAKVADDTYSRFRSPCGGERGLELAVSNHAYYIAADIRRLSIQDSAPAGGAGEVKAEGKTVEGFDSPSATTVRPPSADTASKVLAADVKRLREETGCGMHDAKRGLELRGGDYDLAKEWVLRHNLAVVMSDEARFPLYHASAYDHSEQQFGCYACLVKARETTQTVTPAPYERPSPGIEQGLTRIALDPQLRAARDWLLTREYETALAARQAPTATDDTHIRMAEKEGHSRISNTSEAPADHDEAVETVKELLALFRGSRTLHIGSFTGYEGRISVARYEHLVDQWVFRKVSRPDKPEDCPACCQPTGQAHVKGCREAVVETSEVYALRVQRQAIVHKLKLYRDALQAVWREGVCAGKLKDKVAFALGASDDGRKDG